MYNETNTLFILGNGFDKAFGLKTGYSDFYKYLEKKQGSPLLEKMKENLKSDIDLWSNLEKAFGEFTSKIHTQEELTDLYFELYEYFHKYLSSVQKRFQPSKELKSKFVRDVSHFEQFLNDEDKQKFSVVSKIDSIGNSLWKSMPLTPRRTNQFSPVSQMLYFITFNYTDTLEKLYDYPDLRPGYQPPYIGSNPVMDIIHIHGELIDLDSKHKDKRSSIVLGVDNKKQIKNRFFRNNEATNDFLIKRETVAALHSDKYDIFKKYIYNARRIILYGVSLGETDDYLWKIIGERLKNNKSVILIYNSYVKMEHSNNKKQLFREYERQAKDLIIKRMRLKPVGGLLGKFTRISNELSDRIIVVVNADAFKL